MYKREGLEERAVLHAHRPIVISNYDVFKVPKRARTGRLILY